MSNGHVGQYYDHNSRRGTLLGCKMPNALLSVLKRYRFSCVFADTTVKNSDNCYTTQRYVDCDFLQYVNIL